MAKNIRTYVWQNTDFPHYFCNEKAIEPLEKRFKLLIKTLNDFNKNLNLNEIFIEEVYFNSLIEGVKLNLQSVSNSFYKKELVGNRDEKGAVELFNLALKNSNKPLTHELLKAMNKAILPNTDKAGEYVGDMQIITGNYLYNDHKVIYEGVPSDTINKAMDDFIHIFNNSKPNSPLTNAIKNHIHFENIHPFCDGNGRVGRTLILMSLMKDFNGGIPIAISKAFFQNSKAYYGFFNEGQNTLNITQQIKDAYPLLEIAVNLTKKMLQLTQIKSLVDAEKLNDRQYKVMNTILRYEFQTEFQGGLSNSKYRKISDASEMQAKRDLAQLVGNGLLRKEGKLKGTKYFLNFND